jgi:mycothiol synthase
VTAEVTRAARLTPDQLTAVLALAQAAEAADGSPPLSEQTLLRLRHAAIDGVHLLVNDGRDGYGHVASDGAAELVIAPAVRGRGLGRALTHAALAASAGTLEVWSHGDHPAAAALARSFGFARTRVLTRMRRPLAEPLPALELPPGVAVRAFRPGHDEEAWLRVNARAFASHPEQGRMTLDDLRLRMAEPWFAPAGFLLAERAAELVGFHWTKIHEDGLGEIYVLGIDPAAQGIRLARPLAIAGLEWLRSAGVEVAMLYVDESNPRAVALYEKLGFTPWTTDVTYRREPTAGSAAAGGA